MEKNELKKQLMLQKTMANFGHYCAGNLYYRVMADGEMYQFPIATVERVGSVAETGDHWLHQSANVELSSDLGTTPFPASERASMLWRWIDKAIDAGEFIKLDAS